MAAEQTSPSRSTAATGAWAREPQREGNESALDPGRRDRADLGTGSQSTLRPLRQQRVHDWVVHKLGQRLASEHRWDGVQVCANPGSSRVRSVQGTWPDLVLLQESGSVLGIYEVETPDSVCLAHAEAEWVALSRVGVPFYLVVPAEVEWVAKQILTHLSLRPARLYLY